MKTADRDVIHALAAETAEIAALPVQEGGDLWRRMNALDPARPMVAIGQVCWNEVNVDGELTPRCEDAECRGYEERLRRTLYQWCHFPVVTYDAAETARRMEVARELFDGTLEVFEYGVEPYLSVWDPVAQGMGVQNVLYALIDRPDFMREFARDVRRVRDPDLPAALRALRSRLLGLLRPARWQDGRGPQDSERVEDLHESVGERRGRRRAHRARVETAAHHGCPIELILKDISTVKYDPPPLWRWGEIAMEIVGA